MQAYQLDQKLERKTFASARSRLSAPASAGCSDARITRKCVQLRGVIKGKKKTKGHQTAENSCYSTMAKVQKKSFVCSFRANFLCLVIFLFHGNLVSSRLPNYQYHVESMVETRKALLSYFAGKAGEWLLDTSVHIILYENATIEEGVLIILSFKELPLNYIKVILCNIQS